MENELVIPQTPIQVEEKVAVTKSRTSSVLLILGIALLLILIGAISYNLGLHRGRLLSQGEIAIAKKETVHQAVEQKTMEVSTYQSDKYGFKIEYPSSLKVRAVDYDIQAGQREYIEKCDSEEIEGCGGSRWPDYRVAFEDESKQTLFSVDIHVIPVAKYLGGKENNGFTYYVLERRDTQGNFMPGTTEVVIENIEKSLSFIPAEKPIQCLWTPEFVGIDVSRPGINKESYSQASGFYFDQKNQKCDPFSIYYGDGPNIPFQDMESCMLTCME